MFVCILIASNLSKLPKSIVMSVIEVSGISKQFGRGKARFYALKDVSLDVKEGEILGILGPNGAGKTTLLNIIMGIVYADSGSATIFGESVRKRGAVKIGYVSGEERFHWALTPFDVLMFGGRLYGLSATERKQRAAELLKLFGLEKVVSRKFDVLSTGEKMRLAFAYALINKPKLLLLDEPTLGLDPDIAIKVREEIKRINRELGTTIVLTSHYMQEVEQLCGRIAFINKGRIMHVGSVAGIRKKHINLEAYFVKMAGE